MAIHREKFKTFKNVFDLFTEKNIWKLINQGYFDALESPVSIGKESNIFTALKKDGTRVIVKIYRLSNCDFNKMHQYMIEDPRFVSVKRRRRDTIFGWAKREYMNLHRARDAQVAVPTPYGVFYNILIMEMIGREQPAPKLNKQLPQDMESFLNGIIKNYQKLYNAGLVHGDLSPFNILNEDNKPVFIDMSQSTVLENKESENYLKRDIRNIVTFFVKHGLHITEHQLQKAITHD
ncbi:serine protein kinase RIO [Candidatus Woesearchaeota archaeon]|nr:serine protein kinase RIO [Candidatus Woesearchaeota archaeon]